MLTLGGIEPVKVFNCCSTVCILVCESASWKTKSKRSIKK